MGPLQTHSGVPLAGGAQAGGWFPSVCFVRGLHGAESLDALVGSNHHCWLYRGLGRNPDGTPKFADAVPVKAAGADIVLTNPRFDAADMDGDGDVDLFAGTQPGPVHCFKNTGTSEKADFATGTVVGDIEGDTEGDTEGAGDMDGDVDG